MGPDVCQARGRAIALADGFWSQEVLSAFHLSEVISDPSTTGSCIRVPCFHHWMRSTLDLGWKFHIHPSLVLDCGMHSYTGQDSEWVPSCSYIYSSSGDSVSRNQLRRRLEVGGDVAKAGKEIVFQSSPTLRLQGTTRVHLGEGCLTTTSATNQRRTCTSRASSFPPSFWRAV